MTFSALCSLVLQNDDECVIYAIVLCHNFNFKVLDRLLLDKFFLIFESIFNGENPPCAWIYENKKRRLALKQSLSVVNHQFSLVRKFKNSKRQGFTDAAFQITIVFYPINFRGIFKDGLVVERRKPLIECSYEVVVIPCHRV